jgi:dUTP pyrophosphatase
MDIYASEDVEIPANQRAIVPTGIAVEVPAGFVALFWDRSGLAAKSGITTLAGVIDASYQGEWKVVLFNTTHDTYRIQKGERVAQVLIQQIVLHTWKEVSEFATETRRKHNGFGSTGR